MLERWRAGATVASEDDREAGATEDACDWGVCAKEKTADSIGSWDVVGNNADRAAAGKSRGGAEGQFGSILSHDNSSIQLGAKSMLTGAPPRWSPG